MARRLRTTTGIAVAAAVLGAANPAAAAKPIRCADAKARPLPTVVTVDRAETSIHCLINRERVSRDLPALRFNSILQSTARGHSNAMRINRFFSHDSINGTPFTTRVLNAGYVQAGKAWLVGENIAWGNFPTIKALIAAWMQSPSHRASILDPRFREIGVGVDWGQIPPRHPYGIVATTDFGWVDRRGGGAAAKAKK